jgi:bifunctional DNA-binding transcriptional regulator/antitoxin component of YhaV-PrlF toxin-antitoxin module
MTATVVKTSKISKAVTGSDSLRTTIPKSLADDLGLKVGDILDWDVVPEKGKRYLRARKLE